MWQFDVLNIYLFTVKVQNESFQNKYFRRRTPVLAALWFYLPAAFIFIQFISLIFAFIFTIFLCFFTYLFDCAGLLHLGKRASPCVIGLYTRIWGVRIPHALVNCVEPFSRKCCSWWDKGKPTHDYSRLLVCLAASVRSKRLFKINYF